MFESVFYEINSDFDSNLTNYTNFDTAFDYVLRFVVIGWEVQQPDGARFRSAAASVAKVLAEVGDVTRYDVKSVTFQRVPQGEKIGYYSPSWYTVAVGSGYTDEMSAGDGAWVIDMVFRPQMGGKAWTNVEKWTQILAGGLVGSRGAPNVFCAGLISLEPTKSLSDFEANRVYSTATSHWRGKQGFWQIYSEESESSSTGFIARYGQINQKAPGRAWNMQSIGQVGEDGFGIAMGSAFVPSHMRPITTGAFEPGIDPGRRDKNGKQPPIDPDTGLPIPPGFQELDVSAKVGAALVGAAALMLVYWSWQRARYR